MFTHESLDCARIGVVSYCIPLSMKHRHVLCMLLRFYDKGAPMRVKVKYMRIMQKSAVVRSMIGMDM